MTGRAKKPAAPRKKANGYKMPAPIPPGEVIHDTIMKKKWRIGPSIGVGGFGEIYSACEHESAPKKGSSYPFVIKIEPHENGPLFVEKNFYCRNASKDEIAKYMKENKLSSLGMPTYFGNGSHEYKGEKYRYLVLERYGKDLWTIFKDNGRSFPPATVFQLGLQMLEVLEYIHQHGYVHADIKGANILLGLQKGTENQAYLVDFGLATRVNDKEFKPDPKCAHNGTIEYTSRDAHLGVPTMRGDLEILGYNMLQWLTGDLPWEKSLKQPKVVQDMKENFMKNVPSNITKQFSNVPDALIKFFEYINTMKPKDVPDYTKCRQILESYLKTEGKNRHSKLEFTPSKTGKKKIAPQNVLSNGDVVDAAVKKVTKRGRKNKSEDENSENEEPEPPPTKPKVKTVRSKKRKSIEPAVLVKVKRTKLAPRATPPVKKNHANIATQTSVEKPRRSPRQVSFDSPICEVISDSRSKTNGSLDSSRDMFEDSFEEPKKTRRKLLSDEEILTKVVKKKTTTTRGKPTKSWKDAPTVLNGRSPPK